MCLHFQNMPGIAKPREPSVSDAGVQFLPNRCMQMASLTVRWRLLIGVALLACCLLLHSAGQVCFDHVGLGLDGLLLPVHQVQQHRRYDGCSDPSSGLSLRQLQTPLTENFDSPSQSAQILSLWQTMQCTMQCTQLALCLELSKTDAWRGVARKGEGGV